MWYCDLYGELQHMEPREILKQGKLDFTACLMPAERRSKTLDISEIPGTNQHMRGHAD